jgi:hypothetical protein
LTVCNPGKIRLRCDKPPLEAGVRERVGFGNAAERRDYKRQQNSGGGQAAI